MSEALYAKVDTLVRDVGDTLLMRHWRALAAEAVREKSKGDFVTDVDEEAERQLSAGLLALCPQSRVLGEEAVAADPAQIDLLQQNGQLWVIDPIDGTSNYIDGKEHFAIMVALMQDGVTEASWIYQPVLKKMFAARRGQGAFCNAVRLSPRASATEFGALHVGISVKFTPEPLRSFVADRTHHFASHAPFMCAGFEYAALAAGEKSMAIYHRLLPWDHLPGLLLVQEAGLVLRHFDGTDYLPRARREGLMVAANDVIWQNCLDLLIPPALRV
jgi:fructose-1,6-bisphosphatase/inositol monophosphatase family enzyme